MLIYHLGNEQWARWWPQFRDVVSPHRYAQHDHVLATNNSHTVECASNCIQSLILLRNRRTSPLGGLTILFRNWEDRGSVLSLGAEYPDKVFLLFLSVFPYKYCKSSLKYVTVASFQIILNIQSHSSSI
jgi:hypothetical protein